MIYYFETFWWPTSSPSFFISLERIASGCFFFTQQYFPPFSSLLFYFRNDFTRSLLFPLNATLFSRQTGYVSALPGPGSRDGRCAVYPAGRICRIFLPVNEHEVMMVVLHGRRKRRRMECQFGYFVCNEAGR